MKIVCATNMPFALEAFRTLGETRILEGRTLTPADVRDVEILALRSTTQVNRDLLEGSRVRFVGTATIGTDHLDIPYLERRGIRWCFAPGCNANSVSEYVTAALLTLGERHGLTWEGKTLGIIGVGNVGSRVALKGDALGLRVLKCDPPRARGAPASAGGLAPGPFVSLERILAESDVITVHVPLTRTGEDKTLHLADAAFFDRARRGVVFLNAARGPVVDTPALLAALERGQVSHAVLDTWEGEPDYHPGLVQRVDLGTPHIAGHSFEGKVMGTVMVYREVCRFLGVPATWSHEPLMPPPLVPEARCAAEGRADEAVLREVVRQVYDIEGDDQRFRATAAGDAASRKAAFDRLRKEYPERREFRYTRVAAAGAGASLARKLAGLGFVVA
jgi:erythronate-4-phosphate dehydrogenase